MNILIRKANPSDWQIIQKLNYNLYLDNLVYDKNLNLEQPFSENGTKGYIDDVSSKDKTSYIAFDSEKAIGYIVGSIKIENYRKFIVAEIEHMFISDKYRSLGIGSKLVEKIKLWAKSKNIKHLYVSSYFMNEKAVKFYKKQGLIPLDIGLEGEI